jgi:hypothetical protein
MVPNGCHRELSFTPMLITVDRVILEALFKHAASAAHLVGPDDGVPDARLGPPGDHIDVIARNGTRLLDDAHLAVARAPAAAPDDRASQGAAPMLRSGAGGTQ